MSPVSYENASEHYFNSRKLKKTAGWPLLWALGVGAVIAGDYFGWNFGLAYGGFTSLAWATALMACMYLCLVYCIAELTAALPHAGGFYSFTRQALGPWGGFICGLTDTLEYVITPAVIVVGMGGYLQTLLPQVPVYLLWGLSYAFFIYINIRGVELTLKLGLFITALALAVLLFFYGSALVSGAFSWSLVFNSQPSTKASFTDQLKNISQAIPFAIWFFLAIEQLPLAAEEAHDVVRDIPRALIFGILTLFGVSSLTLIINSGVGGGATQMAVSQAPLADGFRAIFGENATTTLLSIMALVGMVASFHTIIYAYGRVLFALSRAGYFPRFISVTSRFHTPHRALILGGILGLGSAVLIDQLGSGLVGAALLNMAVFASVMSYILVLISFIVLRAQKPQLPRPYKSPLGLPGAWLGLILAVVALSSAFSLQELRPGLWGVLIVLGLGLVYFFFYSRHRLVANAPEEQIYFARPQFRDLDK